MNFYQVGCGFLAALNLANAVYLNDLFAGAAGLVMLLILVYESVWVDKDFYKFKKFLDKKIVENEGKV